MDLDTTNETSCEPSSSTNPSLRQQIYGGIDPEVEENFHLLEPVADGAINGSTDRDNMLPAINDSYGVWGQPRSIVGAMPSNPPADRCPLLDLPGELVDAILAYLTPLELTTLSAACRTFHRRALSDSVWASIAKANIPGPPLASPYPFNTYHDLYKSLETKWFLTKHKLWFCDRDLVGRMIICRWNQRTGGLEGFQLVAVSNHTKFHSWGAKSGVVIHMFEPKVALHTEKPVIKFIAGEQPRARRGELPLGTGFQAEVPMVLEENPRALQCNFMLARPLEKEAMAHIRYQNFPYRCVWPPPSVPASHRVAGAPGFTGSRGLMKEDIPTCRSEASSHAFRIRQWIEMSNNPASPDSMLGQGLFSLMEALTGNGPSPTIPMRAATMRARVEEEIITYSTLDPVLYTPTELKPWRGIWVGDYSGHGCEFLLITQSDDPEISDEELGLVQREYESEQDWQRRRYEARLYRGRLEAVKLTGDPNVPRGEFTFVADDLGENGFVGIAQEDPFRGARVVKSRGHIAREGFRGNKYVESRLLLVSKNRLAQYWLGFGHISFFERVDIDQFLDPELY